jgi:hypothetical protein
VIPSIVRLLRIASFVMCTIVVLSFGAFAIEKTRGASDHQQEQLAGSPRAVGAGAQRSNASSSHEGSVHRALDDASGDLTSPFAGVLEGTGSEWAIRGAKLLLALIVYGFGLGYLARVLRVRV